MSRAAYASDKILAHPEWLASARSGGHPYPRHLHLCPSGYCQLGCGGCAYRTPGYPSSIDFGIKRPDGSIDYNPARFLPAALVEKVLDDCVEMDCCGIEFTGSGEPTVHPDFRRLLEYAQAKRLHTALVTNGLRLVKHVGDAAVRTQWLRVSVDAATTSTFMRLRPRAGGRGDPTDFTTVLDAIEWAAKRRGDLKTGCTIGFGFVVQRDNYHEIYPATRLAQDLGADNIRISGLFTSEWDKYHDDFRRAAEDAERRAFADFDSPTFRVYGRYSEKMRDLAAQPDYERCWYQEACTYLGDNGILYRCCVTSYSPFGALGDVAKVGGLKALWDDPAARARIERFDARACTRCQFNDRNRAIASAIAAPSVATTAIRDMLHPYFV